MTSPTTLAPLHLHLPATLASVDAARLALLAHLAPLALERRAVYGLELVLEEVVLNICLHAYRDEPGHRFTLQASTEPGRVWLQFEDSGPAFDPLARDTPERPATLDDTVPGGLGLVLLRQHATHLAYQRLDGRNRLTLALPTA